MCHSFYVFELHKPKKKNETIIDNHRSTSFLDGYEKKKTATNFIGIPNTCFIKKTLKKTFGFSIVFVYFVIVGRSSIFFLQVQIPRYLKKYGTKFVCLQ